MLKLIYILGFAVFGFGLWHGFTTSAVPPDVPSTESAAAPRPHPTPNIPNGTTDYTTDPLYVQTRQLRDAANQAGGVEMNNAGFHQYPGNSLAYLGSYPVNYPVRDAQGNPTGGMAQTQIDLFRDEILTRGVIAKQVIPSSGASGYFDVQVKFNLSIPPYASTRQVVRDRAYALGVFPEDLGVALIHNNWVYGDFTYGEIATASANQAWVTVVTGTDQQAANNIAAALP